jgi:hypothetical protein
VDGARPEVAFAPAHKKSVATVKMKRMIDVVDDGMKCVKDITSRVLRQLANSNTLWPRMHANQSKTFRRRFAQINADKINI